MRAQSTAAALRRLSSATTSSSGRAACGGPGAGAGAVGTRTATTNLPSSIGTPCSFACVRTGAGLAMAATFSPTGRQARMLLPSRGFAASTLRRAAAESAPTTPPAPARSRDATTKGPAALIRAYKQLSKFRLTCLVVATAAAGFVAGSPETVDKAGLAWATAGTAACAACANTLNQAYEISSDARMARTAARPLPSGRLTRAHALWFALATGAAGIGALSTQVNDLAAALGAGTIVLYAAVYTPLKALTPAATWVGAVVGAIPPLIGWAGSAGTLQPGAAVLGLGLYFWQLPHFMALARLGREDYARGGLKMLCHADPSGRRVAGCALRNALYLLPLGFAAVAAGAASPPFGAEAAVATGVFAATAAAFYAKPTDANARWVFRASLFHLPAWMGAFLVHRIPNTPAARAAQAPDAVRARAEEFWGRGRMTGNGGGGGGAPPHPAWPPAAPVAPRALPFPIGLAPTPPAWMGSGEKGRDGG